MSPHQVYKHLIKTPIEGVKPTLDGYDLLLEIGPSKMKVFMHPRDGLCVLYYGWTYLISLTDDVVPSLTQELRKILRAGLMTIDVDIKSEATRQALREPGLYSEALRAYITLRRAVLQELGLLPNDCAAIVALLGTP